MNRFFLYHISHQYKRQNKLQDEIYNYLAGFDRTLIPYEDMEEYKVLIENNVKQICAQFKRHKPIEVDWGYSTDTDLVLKFKGAGICYSQFLLSKAHNI